MTKLTKAQEMIDLRKKGASYREIARKIGCSSTNVFYHVRRSGEFNSKSYSVWKKKDLIKKIRELEKTLDTAKQKEWKRGYKAGWDDGVQGFKKGKDEYRC